MWVFVGLPFAVGIVTICLGNISGNKYGREIILIGVEVDIYLEIVKILFSPKVISRTPSSQPSFY